MTAVDLSGPAPTRLQRIGDWLLRHQRAIRALQWVVVLVYLVLVAIPAFLTLPDRTAHIWNNLTLFAQFVFWGIWWPFVLLSMVLVGRAWCGFLCPEGALTEIVSRYGQGRHLPRWLTWGGWPFVAFACTTIYGQMVSVYQYPKPVLIVLGGSTLAAIVIGLRYGRNKRVWCRYLCPVNGVFALLSKLAPLHFAVDQGAWRASQHRREHAVGAVNCAPLVAIRTMRGASQCHMCGRCSGFRDAVALSPRSPNDDIVKIAGRRPNAWESALIIFGLMGIGAGAFHWPASPWFIAIKQWLAEWLVDHDVIWPLQWAAPWWLLTNYPQQNDVMNLLDGAVLLGYIGATAVVIGGIVTALVVLATGATGRWSWRRFHHLTQALIPIAGCGVFLGLSALTVTMLRSEGLILSWIGTLRILLLAGAWLWSVWLGWRVAGEWSRGTRRGLAGACLALAAGVGLGSWVLLFWLW